LELTFEDGSDEEEVGKRAKPGEEYGSTVNMRRRYQTSGFQLSRTFELCSVDTETIVYSGLFTLLRILL